MKVLWGTLLAAFAAVNIYVFATVGISGLVDDLRNLGPWGLLASLDLLIALAIGINWMWQDARMKGAAPLPYALLTVATGSIGLLVYLIRHDESSRQQAQDDGDQMNTRIKAV